MGIIYVSLVYEYVNVSSCMCLYYLNIKSVSFDVVYLANRPLHEGTGSYASELRPMRTFHFLE